MKTSDGKLTKLRLDLRNISELFRKEPILNTLTLKSLGEDHAAS